MGIKRDRKRRPVARPRTGRNAGVSADLTSFLHFLGADSLEDAASIAREPSRIEGIFSKCSVTLSPFAMLGKQLVGRREFSGFVNTAVERAVWIVLGKRYLQLLDNEYGPISEDSKAEARKAWDSFE